MDKKEKKRLRCHRVHTGATFERKRFRKHRRSKKSDIGKKESNGENSTVKRGGTRVCRAKWRTKGGKGRTLGDSKRYP